jgi:hypothetical protein
MRKRLSRFAAAAAFLTLAFGSVSASADPPTWQCPPGVKDHHYCVKVINCEHTGLQQHDCRSNSR